MAAVLMDSGKAAMLKLKVGLATIHLGNSKYHLYTNNITPGHADTFATYTEGAWTGYSAQLAGGWTNPSFDGTFHATTTGNVMTWVNSSAATVTVYGYFVTDNGGTTLMFAERFSGAPLSIPVGMSLQVTPTITDQSEF